MGYEGNLTQAFGAVIHGQQTIQNRFAHLGIVVHNLAILEGEVELVHDLSAYCQRHGGSKRAIHFVGMRHAENFLRGDVGEEHIPTLAQTGTAIPNVLLGQSHHQIRAGAFVVNGAEAGFIHEAFMFLELFIMLFPGLAWVLLVYPAGFENVFP